jgi:hypothetical protein
LLSRSFGTLLAVGVALAVAALVKVASRDRRRHASRVVVIGAVSVSALVATGGVLALRARGLEALLQSMHERMANWVVALEIGRAHVVTGVGYARFAPAYLALRPADANVTRYAHSAWLQLFAEEGGVGLALALVALVGVIVVVMRHVRRAPLSWSGALLGACALLFMVRSAIDYDLQVGASAGAAAACVGLLLAGDDVARPPRGFSLAVLLALLVSLAAVAFTFIREGALSNDEPGLLRDALAMEPRDDDLRLALVGHVLRARADCSSDCEDLTRDLDALLVPFAAEAHAPPEALRVLVQRAQERGDDVTAVQDRLHAADPHGR